MGDGTGDARASREPAILLAVAAVLFVVLGWRPEADRFTWFMENFPILLGAPLLLATYRRFPLTPLAYRLLLFHACVLMVGGHWTYARVPLGEWAKDLFHLERNHYDRLGHLTQGFVPAILVREVLVRTSPLRPGKWLSFLVVCVCLAVSAGYEFIEWWTALAKGEGAADFLGTQGDMWDTQWDMCLATVGASLSLALLSRLHDRQLAALGAGGGAERREGMA
jgi:putative membrane protein